MITYLLTPWRRQSVFARRFHWICILVVLGFVGYHTYQPAINIAKDVRNVTTGFVELKTMQAEVARHNQLLGDVLAERVIKLKNPEMVGIKFQKMSGITLIGPVSTNIWDNFSVKVTENSIIDWAHRSGYDGVLFGTIYESLSGEVLWCDYNGKNETDLGVMIETLKKKGLKNIFAFVNNPSNRFLPHPISSQIMGVLHIEEKPVYAMIWFWDTGKTFIEIAADNAKGKISSNGYINLKVDNLKTMVQDNPGKEVVEQLKEKVVKTAKELAI